MNYLSALAADHVAFNSDYHRDDFIGALATLAGEGANWLDHHGIATIAAKSSVLPVGVDLSWSNRPKPSSPVPLVLWNHRWEFDKAPDLFARVIASLAADGCQFQVALAGDPGPSPHPALFELRDALGPRVVQFGRAHDLADYRALLLRSSIAVSTARHEFFGIGTVEALAAGCLPVAPRRYNYPALVPAKLHDLFLWDDEDGLKAALRAALQLIAGDSAALEPIRAALRQSASRFAWEAVAPRWDAFLASFSLTGR
jgi:glycosyltransferase involved in cell wall biosynthesis